MSTITASSVSRFLRANGYRRTMQNGAVTVRTWGPAVRVYGHMLNVEILAKRLAEAGYATEIIDANAINVTGRSA